jgi:hypothetical protein
MRLFEKELNDYIKIHTRVIPPNSLDPRVWYFTADGGDPILQPGIKQQIIRDIDRINEAEQQYVKTRVWNYFMVGPIVKEGSTKYCSINIVVQINKTNLDDMLKEHILNAIKDINGRLATGTQHPIHYIPTIREFNTNDYYAVYHPYTEEWLKKPRFLGESKTDLAELGKMNLKKRPKQSLKKGIKKLTTV